MPSPISPCFGTCVRALRPSTTRLSHTIPSRTTTLLTQRRLPPIAQQQRRHESTTAAASPESTTTSPKITTIVDQISQLTLLETADLVSSLKSRLHIPDLPIGNFSSPGAGPSSAPPPTDAEDDPAAAAPAEKTLFTLTLKSFDPASKPKVIKEIKQMLGLSLVESKKFVEAAPKTMKEGVPKEESEKIVEAMKALGAVVVSD